MHRRAFLSTMRPGNQRGIVVVLALLVLAILAVLMTATLRLATSEVTLANNQHDHSQARALAESGLEFALAFVEKDTISTLPDNFTGPNTTAEIRVHPSGQFLYNTNRGHNSVTMFKINTATGELDVIGWESTRGEWPRGMNIDPSGTFLYAANQNTDTITVFRIQDSKGKLKFSTLVHTPTPVDVEFGSAV